MVLVVGVLAVGTLLGIAIAGGLASSPKRAPASLPSTTQAAEGSGGGSQSTTTTAPVTTTTTKQQAMARLLSMVTMTPAKGHKARAGGTLTLRAIGAQLGSVVVRAGGVHTITSTSPRGSTAPVKQVPGRLEDSGHLWRSTGLLLPSTGYTVSYSVSGLGGLTAHGSGTFATAAPADPLTVSIWPVSGISVGVGEPVQFTFSQPLTDAQQKAVLSRARVDMSKPVAGGWHWFSPTDLHFRPTHLWPAGERAQATIDLKDWHLSGGSWGVGTYQTRFAIGHTHISVVNLATHVMTVSNDGQVIYRWPISAGAAQWPTQDGIHIVLDRSSKVQMISSSVGIPVNSPNGYNESVYWDTQISYSGEYVHAAPWSLSVQGIANVSHGCVNLSPARAEAFFHFSRVGDVVDVLAGVRPPLATDGGLEDWSFGPSQVSWTPAKVGLLTAPVTILPTTTLPPPFGAPTTLAPVPTVPPGGTVTRPVPSTYPPYTPPSTTVYVAPTTTVPTRTSRGTTTTTVPATTGATPAASG